MASKNTKARAQSYSMLTDIEKNILKRHYDGGMVGTGRKYQAMITRAVEETDLARERVEVSSVYEIPNLIPFATMYLSNNSNTCM